MSDLGILSSMPPSKARIGAAINALVADDSGIISVRDVADRMAINLLVDDDVDVTTYTAIVVALDAHPRIAFRSCRGPLWQVVP